MRTTLKVILIFLVILVVGFRKVSALERPDVEFKIFQFPHDKIPRIDGDLSDWDIVPESYIIGTDQLKDGDLLPEKKTPDTKDFDIKVKVGWVKGMNYIYFLVEAYDDYWNFIENPRSSLKGSNDLFELVIDGDLSGGPFIKQLNPNKDQIGLEELHFKSHGQHAQNHHINLPPGYKDWNFIWSCAQWIKDLPYANYAYSYTFKPGESGKLICEFWITPFDYTPCESPEEAVISRLNENEIIGISWALIDYDGLDRYDGFYSLSHMMSIYGDASRLCKFRLMPLEKRFIPPIRAFAKYTIIDMDTRKVAFKDLSEGTITKWHWDFGDETTSEEQNPIHSFDKPGGHPVLLTVEGPAGKSVFPFVYEEVYVK